MTFQKIRIPLLALVLLIGAAYIGGIKGVVFMVSVGALWLLLHAHRLIHVMQSASARPIGYVKSAVMLHAKLKTGMTLMHVTAMTKSLGQRLSCAEDSQETYVWRDAGEVQVCCIFEQGRLISWRLQRPS